MPSFAAAATARSRARDAIATTFMPRPACMAGMVWLDANDEAPSTPQRNMACLLLSCCFSNQGAVGHHAVLGDDHDALADVVAIAVLLLDAGFVDDAHAASDARVLVDNGVLDHRLGPDADRRHAA